MGGGGTPLSRACCRRDMSIHDHPDLADAAAGWIKTLCASQGIAEGPEWLKDKRRGELEANPEALLSSVIREFEDPYSAAQYDLYYAPDPREEGIDPVPRVDPVNLPELLSNHVVVVERDVLGVPLDDDGFPYPLTEPLNAASLAAFMLAMLDPKDQAAGSGAVPLYFECAEDAGSGGGSAAAAGADAAAAAAAAAAVLATATRLARRRLHSKGPHQVTPLTLNDLGEWRGELRVRASALAPELRPAAQEAMERCAPDQLALQWTRIEGARTVARAILDASAGAVGEEPGLLRRVLHDAKPGAAAETWEAAAFVAELLALMYCLAVSSAIGRPPMFENE